jgi:hypothetical protein
MRLTSGITAQVDVIDRITRVLGRVSPVGSTLGRGSAGILSAPLIGTVLADSGALAAGVYRFEVAIGGDTAGQDLNWIVGEHRDAANAATLYSFSVMSSTNKGSAVVSFHVSVALNERIRVLVWKAGLAGQILATLWWQRFDP